MSHSSNLKNFSPLLFLAALGAGGISVIPFAFFQYTVNFGKGLVTRARMPFGELPFAQEILYYGLELVMVVFAVTHVVLTIHLLGKLIPWLKTKEFKEFFNNPLTNAGILAPFISLAMSMNVVIGPIRYFIPFVAKNLQNMMLPALIGAAVLWAALLLTEVKLLKISFVKSFDVNKIHFGWLLHPFALGMVTVTLSGIAAISKNAEIAHTAFFMLMVSGTMGVFLLVVKMIAIFQSHFAMKGLPEKQFLPSFLIVIPNITLYAITAFRVGHYFEKQFHFHLDAYFVGVIVVAFAFQTWYMLFGLVLLKDYIKHNLFHEFHVSQWGLVCPMVAYSILAAFTYKVFVSSIIFEAVSLLFVGLGITLYGGLMYWQTKCARRNASCDKKAPAAA